MFLENKNIDFLFKIHLLMYNFIKNINKIFTNYYEKGLFFNESKF